MPPMSLSVFFSRPPAEWAKREKASKTDVFPLALAPIRTQSGRNSS